MDCMVAGVPRLCMAMYSRPRCPTVESMAGSSSPAEMSLTMTGRPSRSQARSMIPARVVSMDTATPVSSVRKTGLRRDHSSSSETSPAPGRVDTAPMSTMSGPASITDML